jgi:hypothetical protein
MCADASTDCCQAQLLLLLQPSLPLQACWCLQQNQQPLLHCPAVPVLQVPLDPMPVLVLLGAVCPASCDQTGAAVLPSPYAAHHQQKHGRSPVQQQRRQPPKHALE